jgi:Asp-tRNA(Asn)/Glu-tRNA(Gln) amidotransferase A subunit family amidase
MPPGRKIANSKFPPFLEQGMSDLIGFSLRELLSLLSTRKISSVEITRACLDRIDKLEPDLHAFITLCPEYALDQAKKADKTRAVAEKSDHPPLLGLPIAVKDVLSVKDIRCTSGSRIRKLHPPLHRDQCTTPDGCRGGHFG